MTGYELFELKSYAVFMSVGANKLSDGTADHASVTAIVTPGCDTMPKVLHREKRAVLVQNEPADRTLICIKFFSQRFFLLFKIVNSVSSSMHHILSVRFYDMFSNL